MLAPALSRGRGSLRNAPRWLSCQGLPPSNPKGTQSHGPSSAMSPDHVDAGFKYVNGQVVACDADSYSDQPRAASTAASCSACGVGTSTNGVTGSTVPAACGAC